MALAVLKAPFVLIRKCDGVPSTLFTGLLENVSRFVSPLEPSEKMGSRNPSAVDIPSLLQRTLQTCKTRRNCESLSGVH